MRMLITGGAGFLGSHMCDLMIAEGHQVICMDNFLTGRPENIAHLIGNPQFELIDYDVTNYIHVDGPLDFILHLASPASPVDFEDLGIRILKVGALGTHKTLGLALAKKAKFLLTSTSEVYGDPLVHPQSEDYLGNVDPIGMRGVYDEAKRFAEAMTMAYHRLHGVDVRIVRIFNTYGERMRQDDGRAIPNFVSQALTGRDLTVYGDGSQSRCFGFVKDVVSAMIGLIEKPAARGDIFNIGSSEEISIQALAEQVREMTGSDSEIVNVPYDQAYAEGFEDMPRRTPDLAKISRLTGYQPVATLADILSSVIAYYRAASRGD